nr:hypothetical protein [Tanacetum cinerariifolium]
MQTTCQMEETPLPVYETDTLTPDLLVGPTYELMKGSCSSLTELVYHFEEVYKATTDQLDWVNPEVRRDDDQIYKFKEGDFKRLRLQDIEDMLLLLVQGKLSNLTVEERLAFNVSLRMFTRSIVIQRRVEDLQLGVESYPKKLNLTRPDTKGDKDRAAAMIQAIEKMLKTRRIMRSLEKFVGGRLYEGDMHMLQRTI